MLISGLPAASTSGDFGLPMFTLSDAARAVVIVPSQLMMRRRRTVDGSSNIGSGPLAFLRAIAGSRLLPHLTGRLIGVGFRPEHARTEL
jgi:hypothetical protein